MLTKSLLRTFPLCLCLLMGLGGCDTNTLPPAQDLVGDRSASIELDSLKTNDFIALLRGLEADSINERVFDQLLKRSKWHEVHGATDSVFFFDSLLLASAQKANSIPFMAKGQSYLAYDYREQSRLDSAYHYYNLAQKSFKLLYDSIQIGRKLLEMAKIQYRQAAHFESKETITEALQYFDTLNSRKYWAVAQNELAHNFMALGDHGMAEAFYKNAIQTDPEASNRIIYSNNLAGLYREKGDLKASISLYTDLLQQLPEGFDATEKARIAHNLALSEWQYDNQDPLPEFKKALQTRKQLNDLWGLQSSYKGMFEYYLGSDTKLAKKYYDSLLLISRRLKNPDSELKEISSLLKTDPIKYAALNPRFITLTDSIERERRNFKNQFAYLKYLDAKEKAQLLALRADNAEKEVQLLEKETQGILLLAFTTLLIMGGVSWYFLLRQNHKKEKLQEVYNTEQRISQELHDGLANKVFGIIAKTQGKYPEDEDILNGLDNIYGKIRSISHHNRSVQLSGDFGEELGSLVEAFQYHGVNIITSNLKQIPWNSLNGNKRIIIYRVVNELLVNMEKHAKASLVSMRFEEIDKQLRITYQDNGMGPKPNWKKGVGLSNTENRIKSVGGSFNFTKGKNGGVVAAISIPI